MAAEKSFYYWTDRQEQSYAVLRQRGTHWIVEWGDREPPGGDGQVQRGEHVSSSLSESVKHFLKAIGEVTVEPDEVTRAAAKLGEELAAKGDLRGYG